MKNQPNESLLFPVDKSKADSLKQLSDKLEKMAKGRQFNDSQTEETIADDFDASDEDMAKIKASEKDMRGLLKTMNIDYDALIRMDGKSVYARAVAANPAVLDYVKSSDNPVLEAVKIAVGFKPYAEFMDKYGSEPNDIFNNIRQEIEGQKSKENKVNETENSHLEQAFNRPSFSGNLTKNQENKASKPKTLDDIFKK